MSCLKRFTLSPLLLSEVPEFAALDDAAVSGWPFAQIVAHVARVKNLGSRQDLIESMVREVVQREDPNELYLKVVEEASGDMVAAGCWKREGPTGRTIATEEVANGESEGVETLFRSMGKAWRDFRDEWFPDEDIYHLKVLCTHPRWQRQGAGSMIVEWGCKRADEEGLKCALHASAAGLTVYTKHGFKVVKETEFSLKEFGVDGVETRRAMIRMPGERE